MSDTSNWSFRWTGDLAVAAVLTVVSAVLLLAPDLGIPVEFVVGVPFLLFLPGYAVVSAVFPESPGSLPPESLPGTRVVRPGNGGPDWVVRVAVSFLLSALLVAVSGVVLSWTVGIRLAEPVVLVCGVTLIGLEIAAFRRARLTAARRAAPLAGSARGALPFERMGQNVALVVAVLALVATVAVVGVASPQSESFTESYVLAEGANGDLAAEDYPSEFVAGEAESLFVGLENHEYRTVSYEVSIVLQEVDEDGAVVAEERVDEFSTELAHGERDVIERQLAPSMTGERLRLQFRVYNGAADEADAPDQTLQLWVDVVEDPFLE